MSTLVFHSSTLGVTEYSTAFTGLTGSYEALADAVYTAGGTTDADTAFVSTFSLGVASTKNGLKRIPIHAYIQALTAATMRCVVATTAAAVSTYAATFKSGRMQRFTFGRGIRDNYLGFTFSNPDGAPFLIDHVEIVTESSKQRKV